MAYDRVEGLRELVKRFNGDGESLRLLDRFMEDLLCEAMDKEPVIWITDEVHRIYQLLNIREDENYDLYWTISNAIFLPGGWREIDRTPASEAPVSEAEEKEMREAWKKVLEEIRKEHG